MTADSIKRGNTDTCNDKIAGLPNPRGQLNEQQLGYTS